MLLYVAPVVVLGLGGVGVEMGMGRGGRGGEGRGELTLAVDGGDFVVVDLGGD